MHTSLLYLDENARRTRFVAGVPVTSVLGTPDTERVFMLPEEAVKEFKELYQKEYGVDLSDEEAAFCAGNLLNLYKAVILQDKNQNHYEYQRD